jgi:NAD+ diphosphatase
MIQDIAPLHLYNEFKNKKPEASSRMLGFGNRSVFLKYDENDTEITFLTYEQLANYYKKNGQQIQPCIYLFAMDGEDYFLTDIPEEIQVEGFAFFNKKDAPEGESVCGDDRMASVSVVPG